MRFCAVSDDRVSRVAVPVNRAPRPWGFAVTANHMRCLRNVTKRHLAVSVARHFVNKCSVNKINIISCGSTVCPILPVYIADPQHTLHLLLPPESTITYDQTLLTISHSHINIVLSTIVTLSLGCCMPIVIDIVIVIRYFILSCHICSCGLSSV